MNPAAVQDELNFWKSFVKTDRFKNNWCSDQMNIELDESIRLFIIEKWEFAYVNKEPFKALDLGSGVVSILRNTVPDSQLVSCDPLANYYSEIFNYPLNEITKPLPYRTEDLPFKEEFDIVHMRNALDHSQNPFEAYRKMEEACKVGGHIIVSGFENEGTAEHWSGFHQWDLFTENKVLAVKDKNGARTTIASDRGASVERRQLENGKWWFNWIVQKQ